MGLGRVGPAWLGGVCRLGSEPRAPEGPAEAGGTEREGRVPLNSVRHPAAGGQVGSRGESLPKSNVRVSASGFGERTIQLTW